MPSDAARLGNQPTNNHIEGDGETARIFGESSIVHSTRCPAPSPRGEPVDFAASSDLVLTTVVFVSIRPAADHLELPTTDPLVDSSDRGIRV